MSLKVAARDILDQLNGVIDQISNDNSKKTLRVLNRKSIDQYLSEGVREVSIISKFYDLELPLHFGIASSTIRYNNQ